MTRHYDAFVSKSRLEGLRDFFMACGADDLEAAWIVLTRTGVEDLDPPSVPDWEAVEFSFNRLFVGPQPPLNPPFASLYMDSEPYVMGPSTLEARNVYRLLGLESPLVGTFPDDHVSLELDAVLAMQASLARAAAPELAELLDYFLEHHVLRWMPAFCDAVCVQEQAHPAIVHAAGLLAHCLAELAAERRIPVVPPYATSERSAHFETVEDDAI